MRLPAAHQLVSEKIMPSGKLKAQSLSLKLISKYSILLALNNRKYKTSGFQRQA